MSYYVLCTARAYHGGRWCRISTNNLQIRIRILLFSSVANKMPTKKVFFQSFLLITYFTSVYKDIKSKEVTVLQKSRFFLLFYLSMEGSGSEQIMTYILRIRIYNTVINRLHSVNTYEKGLICPTATLLFAI
jgi:hypothetical protein